MRIMRTVLSVLLTVCLLAVCFPAAGAVGVPGGSMPAATGETVNLVPWIILMVISGACIVALVVLYVVMKKRGE